MGSTFLTILLLDLIPRALCQTCSYSGAFDLAALAPDASAAGETGRVVLVGSSGIRCTEAARTRLQDSGVCFTFVDTTADPDLFAYMRCMHPESPMHSWVYFNGEYQGDGFRLLSNPLDSRCSRPAFSFDISTGVSTTTDGTIQCLGHPEFQALVAETGANLGCTVDCSDIVDDQFPARFPAPFEATIQNAPLVLFGWSGCPCTNYAREHFQTMEYCYQEDVWPDASDRLFEYLQCRYGAEHHSFIFVGGNFMGNGFSFNLHSSTAEFGAESAFHPLAVAANVLQTCPFLGLMNLLGGELQSCTQENDVMNTGWTRSGSCNWDPNDGGYHEVCVEMTQEFLDISRDEDGNDLSSVVSVGGHWCICAWAFASAVARSSAEDLAAGHPEGITLQCDATNGKLRDVYSHFASLNSPTGHSYLSVPALALVDEICPDVSDVEVEDEVVAVTEDETEAGSDSCYALVANTVAFPLWDQICPELNPLPDVCGVLDISTDPLSGTVPDCSAAYVDWWNRCGEDEFITQLDVSLGGTFTAFASTCDDAHTAVMLGQH